MFNQKRISDRQQVDNLIGLLLSCWKDANRETRKEILALVSVMYEWERLPKLDPNSYVFTIAKRLLGEESVTPRQHRKIRKKRGYWTKPHTQGEPKVFGYRKNKKKNHRRVPMWQGFYN